MNQIKKLAGQTAVYGLSSIIGKLLNYLLVPFYTRIFTDSQYGVVSELYAYVSLLLVLLTYGMETGLFRFAQSEKDFRKVYGTTLLSVLFSSGIFVLLIVLFSGPIAGFLKYQAHPEYIIWFGLIIALDAFSAIPFAKLRQQNKAKKFAIIKLVYIGIMVLLNFFFLWLCPLLVSTGNGQLVDWFYNPDTGVGYVFISNLMANVILLVILLPEILNTKLIFDSALLRKMLVYCLPLLVAGLAGMINETMDRIFLKNILQGTNDFIMAQIGIYGANYKIAILMTLFIQMFRYAAEPFFFSHAKDKNSGKLYADVMKYFVIFGLIIFLGVMMYIDIIKYFIGPAFYPGLKIVPVILLANLWLGIYFNLSIWYKLNDKTKFGAYLMLFGAVITIVLNVVLIPLDGYFGGYMGSAWATFFCYFSLMVASYFLGNKYYPVKYDLKNIFIYIVLAIGLYIISILVATKSTGLNIGINTLFFLGFIAFVVIRENLINVLLKKK